LDNYKPLCSKIGTNLDFGTTPVHVSAGTMDADRTVRPIDDG
jgi:hypothetical protein